MFCCMHFSICACIVFTVACPAGYSLIYNPPLKVDKRSLTSSFASPTSLTGISVK